MIMTSHKKLGYAAAGIAAIFAANTFVSLQASVFSDVPDEAAYATAVSDLKDAGVIQGYEDGTFKPDATINRAEFTKIIVAARFDLDSEESYQCMIRNRRGETILFPDVPADAWFAKHVCMSYEYRLVGGYPDGTFGPERDISFIEASKILVTAYEPTLYPGKEVWYEPYAQKLKEWSAIPPSVIALNQKITRGEMADMMYRVRKAQLPAGATPENSYVPDPAYATIPTLTDVPPPPPPVVEESDESSEEASSEESSEVPEESAEISSSPETATELMAESASSSEAAVTAE